MMTEHKAREHWDLQQRMSEQRRKGNPEWYGKYYSEMTSEELQMLALQLRLASLPQPRDSIGLFSLSAWGPVLLFVAVVLVVSWIVAGAL